EKVDIVACSGKGHNRPAVSPGANKNGGAGLAGGGRPAPDKFFSGRGKNPGPLTREPRPSFTSPPSGRRRPAPPAPPTHPPPPRLGPGADPRPDLPRGPLPPHPAAAAGCPGRPGDDGVVEGAPRRLAERPPRPAGPRRGHAALRRLDQAAARPACLRRLPRRL